MADHVRHGRGSVRPYLYGALELPEFLVEAFGAEELERHVMGDTSAHVELSIGDAVVVVEAGRLPASVTPTVASVYVYVPDVDATYARALQAGATALAEPEDKHYAERGAAIQDPSGNTWYLSTFTG